MSSRPQGLPRELLAEALALCRVHGIEDHPFNFKNKANG
jgi:hypothetical protein